MGFQAFLVYSKDKIQPQPFLHAAAAINASPLPSHFFSPSTLIRVRTDRELDGGKQGFVDASLFKRPLEGEFDDEPQDEESLAILAHLGGKPGGEVMVEISHTEDKLDLVALDFFLALAEALGEANPMVVLGTESFEHLWTVPELRALKARGGRLAPWLEPKGDLPSR